MARPITAALLTALFTGFKTSFRGGFAGVEPNWSQIATRIPSTTGSEDYSWLNEWPKIREWIGERVLKELSAQKYTLTNRDFETTVRVKANHIADDQLGIYGPMFEELGRSVAVFPDELIFGLLAMGLTAKCYDGQPFFDDEHPVGSGVASNFTDGANAAWYLLDTSRSLKPLIYQDRQAFDLTALDKPTDPNVFFRKEFIYGADGRAEAGFGFWQMAHCSKAALSGTTYSAARAKMRGLKSDEGKKLGVRPTLLVVPPSLEEAGRQLLASEQINGTTNVWRNTAELLVADYLED